MRRIGGEDDAVPPDNSRLAPILIGAHPIFDEPLPELLVFESPLQPASALQPKMESDKTLLLAFSSSASETLLF